MSILPSGSTVTFTLSGSSSELVVDSVNYTPTSEFFDRNEFSNDRLKQAKNSDGSSPIFITLAFGKIAQLTSTCTSTTARPIVPDDANIDDIKKKFVIKRWTLKGDTSLDWNTEVLKTFATQHKILLDRFKHHQDRVGMDISYDALITLQAETFSYLTTTGLTMTGNSVGTQTDLLITEFSFDVDEEQPSPSLILKSWNLTLENRVIASASASS